MKKHNGFTAEQQLKIAERQKAEKAAEREQQARVNENIEELKGEAADLLERLPELKGKRRLRERIAGLMAAFAHEKRFEAAAAFLR